LCVLTIVVCAISFIATIFLIIRSNSVIIPTWIEKQVKIECNVFKYIFFKFIVTATYAQHYTNIGPFLNNETMQNWNVLMYIIAN